MKRYKIIFLGITLFLIPLILNCQSNNAVYTHAQKEGGYLELKSDGTFLMKFPNKQTMGKYEIKKGQISLNFKDSISSHGSIIGDTITDGNGENWYLWHGGKTSAEYEIKYAEVKSKIRELRENKSKSMDFFRDFDRKRYDILVEGGFLSREVADRQLKLLENKDGITSSLVDIAANAYQYRIRPTTMGGGGGIYDGYMIPDKLTSDSCGTYTLVKVNSQSIQAKGISAINNSWFVITDLDSTGKVSIDYSESGWK